MLLSIQSILPRKPATARDTWGGRGKLISFAVVLVVPLWFFSASRTAQAETACSTTGGNWTTVGSWTGCNATFPNNGQPAAGDTYNATVTSGISTLGSAVTVDNVTVDSGAEWWVSAPSDTITLNDALTNSGVTEIDASGGQGGSTLNLGGTLTNSGTFDIGVTNLSAPTNVTVASPGTLANAGGTINLQGNATSGTTNQATLNIEGAMPTTVAGAINLSGDALLQVTNGITAIGANSQLSLSGSQARVSIGAGTTNSALSGLASNAGVFELNGDSGSGAGAPTVTTTTGFNNTGTTYVDVFGGEGGSTLNLGGTLTNSGTFDIGVTNLSAPTNVTVASPGTLANAGGTINLQGNATSGTTNQATLNIEGAMPTTVAGAINLSGDALLQVTNGITAIGANSQLSLSGSQARVSIGAGTTNSALSGLASNAGVFELNGDSGSGAGAPTVTTTTGFNNTGTTYVDVFGGEGGSTLNLGGTLTNSGTFDIGVTNLSAPTNVTVASPGTLANAGGTINLQGNATSGTTNQATLNIEGAMPTTVAGAINLSGDALLQVTNGITAIGANSQLSLSGSQARVSIGAGTTNSALSGLASNAGVFELNGDSGSGAGAPTVTTTTGFNNTGTTYVDVFGGEGGSTLNLGGTLTNSGTFDIGVTNLSAPTNVTVASPGTLANAGGTINLQGNATSGTTNQATLNIEGAMPTTVAGAINLSGDALLQVTNGITAIGANSQLSLSGSQARVSIGAGTTNSALSGLASNAGVFELNGDSGSGAGAPTVTTTTGFNNTGTTYVDVFGGEGGSTLNLGGTLTNSGTFDIGVTNLSAPTNVTVASPGTLANAGGTINLQGNATSGTTNQATLNIEGAMPTTVAGAINLSGDALLQVTNGITAIGANSQLSLSGSQARVSIGAGTTNSALSGLASNAGVFELNGDSGSGAGAPTVTTTTGFNNTGTTYVDVFGGEGGSTLNLGGTLTNSGTFDIGVTNLSAPTNVTVAGLVNSNTINMVGGSSTNTANLTVNGAAGNAGAANIGAFSNLSVTGGNAYTQTAGTTTIAANGTLGAANVLVNGGTLQGNGTVVGNVSNSATVAGGIGEQPGTLTINGNFTNTSTGTVASYLSGSPSGNTQVTVGSSGNVLLQGGTISGAPINGLSYAAGQTFTAMNFQPGNLTGLFAGVANGTNTPTLGTSTNLGNNLTLGVVYNDHAGNIELQVVNTPASTADTWNGGTGSWATAGAWSAGVPQFYSTVTIGATGSGDVTLGQDTTIESLAINSGNTLQYQAGSPWTLAVGSNVTVNSGGALSLPTSGDKLALGGNFSNSGTTSLGAGASLYGLGTFTNSNTASIGNGASVATLGAATNQSGAHLTLAGGALNAPSFANAGTTSGFGTILPAVSNTGLVEASGGTLTAQNGVQGAAGNITVDSGATLDLSHATTGSSAATLAQNGTLALGANNVTVSTDYTNANFGAGNGFNKSANVAGTGEILAAGNVAQAVTGSGITGGTSATPTLALGNVHVDSSTSASYAIENTGTSGPSLRGAIQTSVNGGNITDPALSGSGVTAQNFGPIATGASTSPAYTVNYNPTSAGPLSGQAVHIANNFSNVGEQTLNITGAAYALASPTVTSSLSPSFNFGVIQAGQSYTDQLTIANVQVASNSAYQEGLDASFGTPTNSQLTTNGGSITNLAPGGSNGSAMSVTLMPTTAGTIGGTVPLTLTSVAVAGTGLGNTDLSQGLSYTWTYSGTVVNQASPNISPTSIDFGNVRINTTQQQALSVTNSATTAPQASLDAQISVPTSGGGAATATGGPINQLAPGSTSTSLVAGLNTANAGAQSGTATVALQSDSTPNGCTSNCTVDLTSQHIAVSGNVYGLANPTINTPPVSLAARVNDPSPSQAVSVTNSSPNAYTEDLHAGFGASPSSLFTPSGTITNLAAQGTSSAMSVALNTTNAGSYTGAIAVNFTSTGTFGSGTGSDGGTPVGVDAGASVGLTGNVYTPAVADVLASSPIDFGIVHKGDPTQTANLTVKNNASVTALNDGLVGTVGASGGPFSGGGNLGTAGLGPQQQSSALQVELDTTAAGIFNGTATLALASHDSQLVDLSLATNPVALSAQVNNFAALAFQQTGGQGSLSGSGASYNLDFGDVLQNTTSQQALLAFLNNNPLPEQAFTDLLSSSGTVASGSGFTIAGDSVSGLAGGDTQSGFDVSFDTSMLGMFNEMLRFDVESSNSSGYDQIIGEVNLNLEGDVVSSAPVPEPSSIALLASGLGMLLFIVRRERRRC